MRGRAVADQLQAAPEAEARAAMLVGEAGWLGGTGEPGGVADVAVDVEVADAGEPSVPDDWRGLDAEIDTEAGADVLSARGSAGAGRLIKQDVARCGLDPEIYVRTAEQLDIDEGAAAEIGARVVDAKMAGGVGKGKTERVVLQPVAIEGEDLNAFQRLLGVADGNVAADHPGVEQGADIAPETSRQAVVPAGEHDVLAGAPLWLQCGD